MTPAFLKPPTPPAETGLIIQSGAGLLTPPPGNAPALFQNVTLSLKSLYPGMSFR
jgi:hypothetical protein